MSKPKQSLASILSGIGAAIAPGATAIGGAPVRAARHLPPRPGARSQRYRFRGELGREEFELEVLADEEAATPTGGWPKIAKVARPQRVSYTVPEGYDPIELTIPVLFEATIPSQDREDVEYSLQVLEWMAGRGILFKGKPGHPGEGDPPLIQVWTEDGNGREVPLIPKQYQTVGLQWFITDLAFDTKPNRDASQHRTRQAVKITLLQCETAPGSTLDSSTARALARHEKGQSRGVKGGVAGSFTITEIADRLAKSPAERTALIRAIIKANLGNRRVGVNPEKRLPEGVVVLVPEGAIR